LLILCRYKEKINLTSQQIRQQIRWLCTLLNEVCNGSQRYIFVQSKPSKTLQSNEVRKGLISVQAMKTCWRFTRRILLGMKGEGYKISHLLTDVNSVPTHGVICEGYHSPNWIALHRVEILNKTNTQKNYV